MYSAVQKELEEGRQAYIVLPRQNKTDLLSLQEALSMAGKLGEAFLPDARIGVYSTEMSRLDRIRVFEDFQHRRIDVLFYTAHIEDVPAVRNVACVVLEFADKNSFMRVHRLRGLLYGSYYDACCYLISPHKLRKKSNKSCSNLLIKQMVFLLPNKVQNLRYRIDGSMVQALHCVYKQGDLHNRSIRNCQMYPKVVGLF